MKFKGYFVRANNLLGCIVSDADDTLHAIKRTVFDAIYQSPWKEEDIEVLQIKDFDSGVVLYANCKESALFDFKELLGI